MRSKVWALGFSLLSLLHLPGCSGGVRADNPELKLSVELGPKQGSTVSTLKLCLTKLRFIPSNGGPVVSVDVAVGAVNVTDVVVPLTTITIPSGDYQRVEADLTPTCASGTSVQLTKSATPYDTADSVTMTFSSQFSTDSNTRSLLLEIQSFITPLGAINNGTEIKPAIESVQGSTTPASNPTILYRQSAAHAVFSDTGIGIDSWSFENLGGGPAEVGDFIVCWVVYESTVESVFGVYDSGQGNTYVKATGPAGGSGFYANYRQELWYAPVVTGGSISISAYFTGVITGYKGISCHEFSGVAAANPIDQVASAFGTGTAISVGPVVTTTDDQLILAFSTYGLDGLTGDGFTAHPSFYPSRVESRMVRSQGSYSATFSHPVSYDWMAQIVTLKAE